ncbi:hypothetical protein PAMC26577_11660 [Caballeronia sordidicola]|uniref:Uncharacterized protein n=2 Tax=Caballeronia sordidicola TaxID=196367 RepID=A0A242MXI7_CABSO|nr:hypothetical protein PAMC26577_11660 [Caballeronia sordidicola]
MRCLKGVLIALSFLGMTTGTHAQSTTELPFETHAAFFSAEVGLPVAIDPQVFVIDNDAAAAVGAQGILHIVGLRNARVSDSPVLPVYSAIRKPLHMNLGQWLGARGAARLTPLSDGRETVAVQLAGLVPGARYSLFENHFDQQPIGFSPLDDTGIKNTFKADSSGAARVTVTAPKVLTHENAILVVYHSDGLAHGKLRGRIGRDAHHQLIARVP